MTHSWNEFLRFDRANLSGIFGCFSLGQPGHTVSLSDNKKYTKITKMAVGLVLTHSFGPVKQPFGWILGQTLFFVPTISVNVVEIDINLSFNLFLGIVRLLKLIQTTGWPPKLNLLASEDTRRPLKICHLVSGN